jgi:hypothetical protein
MSGTVTTFPFSAATLQQCAARELKLRRRVYARLVAERHMSQGHADIELAMMAAIAAHYADLAEREGGARGRKKSTPQIVDQALDGQLDLFEGRRGA